MATITEDYVSFETSKLLKEKGFNKVKCQNSPHFSYNRDGQFSGPSFDTEYNAPTIQMAMKWLREAYNINIDIVSIWNQKQFEYQVFVVTPENAKHCYIDDKLYLGYEEAVEAGIKYCLKHLI